MSHLRFSLTLLTAAFAVASVSAGPGLLKKKTDASRVAGLIETLKSDPDERKRKAAADELGGADSRMNPEVATALVAALQKDASPAVRAEAAESLGQLGQVFPVAGQALEAAATNDASAAVKLAAKKSLWEYHLNGYRSPKGADGVSMQTVEPPIASPAAPRPTSAVVPVAAPPAPVTPQVSSLPTSMTQLPPVAPPNGPRVSRPSFLGELLPGPRASIRSLVNPAPPPILNMTAEPPIAKPPTIATPLLPPPTSPVPPPTVAIEPPPLPAPRVPDYVPTLPPFKPDLPSVVAPPGAAPELAPYPKSKIVIPPTLPPR